MGSNPTPRAILAYSSEDFISLKSKSNIVSSLQEPLKTSKEVSTDVENTRKKLNSICKYQRTYIRKSLESLLSESFCNAETVCNYITAEQNEINIKESTKEGKIKVLVDLLKFLRYKPVNEVSKEDVLAYLNRFRKPEDIDPKHSWIGTWNNRHLILSKFFRWLHDPNNPDIKNRNTPPCMKGVKRLSRKEISRYKPSDMWTQNEWDVFLKYCPSKRDKAFLSMAIDTSARPHELLNLRIDDIKFKISSDGSKQFAEITINGKTGQRTVPLFNSLPYVKEWILEHPLANNKHYWLFISKGKASFGKKLTRDGLLKHFQEYYRQKYYPDLLANNDMPEVDKAFIRSLLTKPWNLYVFRHSALTEKSQILNEHMLRNHAGWTTTSTMPQVYIHHLGNASSKQLLQSFGIIEKEKDELELNKKRIRICSNCNEPNKTENKFCYGCKMVLSYDSYIEMINEEKHKIDSLETDIQTLKEGMNKLFLLIQQNPALVNVKPEVLEKMVK